MKQFFINQITGMLDTQAIGHLILGLIVCYYFGKYIYRKSQREFIFIDFKLSVFEKQFYKTFLWYIGWGLIQQSIVLTAVYYIPTTESYFQVATATILFGFVFHLGNWKLIAVTTVLGLYLYIPFYFFDIGSLFYMAIIHGLGGTVIKELNWDLRVWRFN